METWLLYNHEKMHSSWQHPVAENDIPKVILLFPGASPVAAGTSIARYPKTHGRCNLILKAPWEKGCKLCPRVQTNINGTTRIEHHAALASRLQSRGRFSKDPP